MRTNIAKVLVNQGGVIARRSIQELAGGLDWLVRRGELVTVLPGVYASPEMAGTFATRVRAVALSDPDAVILGAWRRGCPSGPRSRTGRSRSP